MTGDPRSAADAVPGGLPSVSAPRVVVMGPSGSGKSVVGLMLAAELRVPFVDADDLHPADNVAKMSAGIPLTDEDRVPWLDVVGERLRAAPDGVVVACSALARRYRDRIRRGAPQVWFVELRVSREELIERMRARAHFMPPSLLDSQLQAWEALQPDEPGASIAGDRDLAAVVSAARATLPGSSELLP